MNLRIAMLALATTAMIGTQSLAADVGPLAAGKPAGVQEAQGSPHPILLLTVGAVIIGAVAIAVALSDNGSCDAAHCPTSNASTPSTGT